MPTFSVASWTVIAFDESKSLLASTTFRSTSGTAFCFTTKYLLFSDILLLRVRPAKTFVLPVWIHTKDSSIFGGRFQENLKKEFPNRRIHVSTVLCSAQAALSCRPAAIHL